MTEWRWVRGYEGIYAISDDGRIWSTKTLKLLTLRPDPKSGYLFAAPRHLGVRIFFYAHREVLRAFVGEPPKDKPWCLHNNDVRTDNRLSNLRWGSREENVSDWVYVNKRHPSRRKTHCPLGHPLEAPNLSPEKLRLGHRKCRACTNGRAFSQHRKIPFIKEYADAAYDRLMEQEVGTRV